MKITASIAILAILILAGITLFVLQKSASQHSSLMPVADRIQYYKLYVDIAKSVLVGFGAALLVMLIPAAFAEARYSFDRLRDSRTAYSEAKTSIDYLPLRLCTVDLKTAAGMVQRAHVRKHEAELYTELKFHLKRRGIRRTPEQWGDGLYFRLFIVRNLLEKHAHDWDSLSPERRLALVREILPAPPMEALEPGTITIEERLIWKKMLRTQPLKRTRSGDPR
jgi:hypothetical protein